MNKHTVVVYGWSDYGFALAHALGRLDQEKYSIKYFTNNEEILSQLMANNYYRNGSLAASLDNVSIAVAEEGLFDGANTIYLDAPLESKRELAKKIKQSKDIDDVTIVSVNGGIEGSTGLRTSEAIAQEFEGMNYHYVQLGGDKNANAVVRQEPLRVGVASINSGNILPVREQLEYTPLKPVEQDDIVTAELSQAFSSILGLYGGVLSGLNYSNSSVAGLVCSLAEDISRLASEHLGANYENMTLLNPFWANSQWIYYSAPCVDHRLGLAVCEGLSINQAAEALSNDGSDINSINALAGIKNHAPIKEHEIIRCLIDIFVDRAAVPEELEAIIYK